MKQIYRLLIGLTFFLIQEIKAQPFVTKWDLSIPGSGATQLSFGVGTMGIVNYTWETIPAGMNGAGTFTGSTATIAGLPAGAMIRLSIDTANFNRIHINNTNDKNRLLDVEQWGGVHWISMENAFHGCSNLNCTAIDGPDLVAVTSMNSMFKVCTLLNGPSNIGSWNTQNVTDMSWMFAGASNFNQPLGSWNTQNVTDMSFMFYQASNFNQPIDSWNTQNDTNMHWMFAGASNFNQPIGSWNTQNVLYMSNMFSGASNFNQPIGSWNTQNVLYMSNMFSGASNFNQPIGSWNTQNVLYMSSMFSGAFNFNQPLDSWNTQNVINMSYMFYIANNFNQPLGSWNTQNVTDMEGMFYYANNFNQPLGSWNTQNVTDMSWMFTFASNFNQSLDSWNIQNVTNMSFMFHQAINFNQPLGSWNTQNVTDMSWMFAVASNFNHPLGTWQLHQNVDLTYMLGYSGLDCINYSSTLIGWRNNPATPSGRVLGASTMKYYATALADRTFLISNKGWIINGDVQANQNCCVSNYSYALLTTCNSYFFNNQNLTSSGVYYDTLLNVSGCDSIIQLNLTISPSSTNFISQTACKSYFFNNQNLTMSGVYYDTLMNTNGCDSIITLNLTINQVNTSVTQSGANLSANASGANYQWLSCNPYQIISGATNQNYTATANGDYAVIVTENGCTDTSACVTVMGIGLNENSKDAGISIYPNPTKDKLYVSSGSIKVEPQTNIEIYNTLGQLLLTKDINPHTQTELDVSHLAKGMYYLRVGHVVAKVIVE